jgi:hypothetical protein
MDNKDKFIDLEEEILMRGQVRHLYKEGGMAELLKCLSEAARYVEIIIEVTKDIVQEENKKHD